MHEINEENYPKLVEECERTIFGEEKEIWSPRTDLDHLTILKRINAIPIHRFNHAKAIDALKTAESQIKQGYHIAIFPEGTRTITGKLNKFKKGGFHMAINTNTKILPIIVQGLYEIKNTYKDFIKIQS